MAPRQPLALRRATHADVAHIVGLVRSAYRGEESRQGWTTEAELVDGQRTDPTEVAEAVSAPGSLMLLAERGGELIGCCRLERRPAGAATLGMLAVRPRLQGRGVGRALVEEAERVARDELGEPLMRLLVLRPRAELVAWYQRLGYQPTGEAVPWPYDDPVADRPRRAGLDFLVLVKRLAAPHLPQ